MSIKSAGKLTAWVLSLGCPKNRVDTEKILGSLGIPVKMATHMGRSELVLINTCAFIEPAARESIRAILDAIERIRTLKRRPLLAVAGCLPGRYGKDELASELPEVDLWLHPQEQEIWPAMIQKALTIKESNVPGRITPFDMSYAWLKIGEGCRHKCAFCTIPSIRGKLKSETADKIVGEAEFLLANGVRELVLVGQDVAAWGQDFNNGPGHINSSMASSKLPGLVDKLCNLPGLAWLRLLYLYPSEISDDLLRFMAATGRPLLPYLDIPFQHSHPDILKSMGRPFSENPYAIVEKISKYLPNAALRTTLITGYPGETEERFEHLCNFVREAKFENLGVFPYYAEDGTVAATLPQQVDPAVREERRQEIMAIQKEVSRNKLLEYCGTNMKVLVDSPRHDEWPGLYAGRVWFQAPEIDGITYVSGPGVKVGAMPECEIVDSHDYDLTALA